MSCNHSKEHQIDAAFAKMIRYFRHLGGLRQRDIAEHLGVSAQQYQKYERGSNRVTIGKVFGIAAALKVPPVVMIEMVCLDRKWSVDRDAERMMRSYHRIRDHQSRLQLVQLAEALAEKDAIPTEED